jgi:hypothetical protein
VAHDLSDIWHGRFIFPRLYAPVSFVATLQQTGDWIYGRVEEPGLRGEAGKILSATISGKVIADAVTFLKTYDSLQGGYDAVRYEGLVSDEGLEISGTWNIPNNWSGPFIMIRSRGLAIVGSVHEEEKI